MEGAAVIAVVIIVRCITGGIAAAIASSKGRNTGGWFAAGFFLDIIGIVIVAVLPNLKEQQNLRNRHSRENRRLREQLRQEKMKSETFRRHAASRLDAHDNVLGVDTRNVQALPESAAAGYLTDGTAAGGGGGGGTEWFYEEGGETKGPVSATELKALYKSRRVGNATLVWHADMEDWEAFGRVAEFRSETAR
ncbi:MAG: DUF4339 domain-containing protein [Planctomycetes bacterium]|nr:DUF4339 domain-containing protein [Planctomycetota bacterium]